MRNQKNTINKRSLKVKKKLSTNDSNITSNTNSIIQEILEKQKTILRPDFKIISLIDKKILQLNEALKKQGLKAECFKGGSIGKETFLKNNHDIDVFVRFDYSYNNSDISQFLEDTLKLLKIKFRRVHGSRDYFQFTEKQLGFELNYELVPVLKIHRSEYHKAKNSTDLSPEHVTWVKSYTEKNPSLKDDIRLAKQFCKANNVYGAESYIKGFSGHIIDILIIHYTSFKNLVEEFSKLSIQKGHYIKNPIIIDHEKHLKNPLKELNESKISPLIIVDPIQPNRNSSAALCEEKLIQFITACKKFIEQPSPEFFEIKKITFNKLLKNKISEYKKQNILTEHIIIELRLNDSSKDITGTKVLKIYELLIDKIKVSDFEMLYSTWVFEYETLSANILFIFKKEKLSDYIYFKGPPVNNVLAYKNFLKVHSSKEEKIIIKSGICYVRKKREIKTPKELLSKLILEDYIKNRAKKIILQSNETKENSK